MKQQMNVPLTSFTMRNNNSRAFEDLMGHNTDLDEGMNAESLLIERGGIKGLLLHRTPLEQMYIKTLL